MVQEESIHLHLIPSCPYEMWQLLAPTYFQQPHLLSRGDDETVQTERLKWESPATCTPCRTEGIHIHWLELCRSQWLYTLNWWQTATVANDSLSSVLADMKTIKDDCLSETMPMQNAECQGSGFQRKLFSCISEHLMPDLLLLSSQVSSLDCPTIVVLHPQKPDLPDVLLFLLRVQQTPVNEPEGLVNWLIHPTKPIIILILQNTTSLLS